MARMSKIERAERKAERAASEARIAAAHTETRLIVASGVCPQCGSALRNNLSITGWWQCRQYGAVGFRADNSKPACSWQGFTE